MTAPDVSRLLALREQATGGEWTRALAVSMLALEGKIPPADAELIVAAVNALPGLCAEVERLRGLLIKAEDAYMDLNGGYSAMLACDKEWRTEAQRLAALSDGGDR